MHNDILLWFLLLSTSFAFSQTLEFRYDQSGNQIERKPVLLIASKPFFNYSVFAYFVLPLIDFNGDGITDALAIEEGHSYRQSFLRDRSHRARHESFHNYFVPPPPPFNEDNITFQTADFNGDGKTDLFVIRDNQVEVYGLNKENRLEKIGEKSDVWIDRDNYIGYC